MVFTPLFWAPPAYADDIADAQTALDAGNALVVDLTIKDDQAAATIASSNEEVLAAQATLDATDKAVTDAAKAVADAQSAYDTQLITQITHTGDGLTATVYNDRGYNGSPPLGAGIIDHTEQIAQINFQWGGGSVLNGPSEDVQIKFTGQITAPTTGTYQFYGPADDGFILKINGQTIINDWRDKGGGGSVSQPVFLTENQPNSLEAWYYENGGGAWVQLNWNSGSGWQVIPATAFGTNIVVQTKDPNLLLVLDNAQTAYDNATLAQAVATDNLNAAIALYNAAIDAKNITYDNLQTALAAIPTLQDSLNKVIEAKRISDEAAAQAALVAAKAEQDRLAAIAAAEEAARQAAIQAAIDAAKQAVIIEPTPTKEPVVEPTPQPTVEPTPTPTISPSGEPTPTPTTTTQPTPEPTKDVIQPTPEPVPSETPAVQPKSELSVEEAVAAIEVLANIVPDKLTDTQAEQLKDAAITVLDTAVQGSAEYNQALEALAVVAQADDPELPAELAGIPGAAAVLDALNALGNIGADMSPKQREESKKIVMSAIVVGQVAQMAMGAAASAASGGSSSGSSGPRRRK